MDNHSLRMLIELAVTSRDAAAARRAQAQLHLAQAADQLELLRGYGRDYDRRAQSTLAAGCDIAAQDNLRAFCARLRRAIEQQAGEVTRRERALAQADGELVQAQRRLLSLEKLAERKRAEQNALQARREQKATDELAGGLAARGTAPAPMAGG